MGQINAPFLYKGVATNGAVAKLWQKAGFASAPEFDDPEPEPGFQEGGTITTGPQYGCDGAYRWLDVPDGEYYVSCFYDSHRTWIGVSVEAISEILIANEDILIKRGGVLTRIPIDSNGKVWTVVGGQAAWATLTLTATQRIAPSSDEYGGNDESYVTKASASIPSTEKSVIATAFIRQTGARTASTCIVYNGVERATVSNNTTTMKGCGWADDGVGSTADLLIQCKISNADEMYYGVCSAYSVS